MLIPWFCPGTEVHSEKASLEEMVREKRWGKEILRDMDRSCF